MPTATDASTKTTSPATSAPRPTQVATLPSTTTLSVQSVIVEGGVADPPSGRRLRRSAVSAGRGRCVFGAVAGESGVSAPDCGVGAGVVAAVLRAVVRGVEGRAGVLRAVVVVPAAAVARALAVLRGVAVFRTGVSRDRQSGYVFQRS